MTNGFDDQAFMEYLEKTFNGFENSFLREMVSNIIAYGHLHEDYAKDQFCRFISGVIPEVTFGEVAYFSSENCLTAWGQHERHKEIRRREKQVPEGLFFF